MAENREVKVTVRLSDRISAGFAEIGRAMRTMRMSFNDFSALGVSLKGVSSAVSGVVSEFGKLALKASVAGGAVLWGFKKNFLDVAVLFEDMQTVLTTLEGSSERAKKAMDWISDFAVTTPYELNEVTEAYKNLISAGIDPVNGSLRAIGDAAAASGKPLLQLVDAVGKAKSGQFEQLRTAIGGIYKMVGQKMTYTFFDQKKQKVTLFADVRNMDALEKMVLEVFKRKGNVGAMDGLSKTWSGMVSNLSDQWTRFSKMVMESGPFTWLKGEMQSLLDTVDGMAADGRLQVWAEKTGAAILDGFITAKEALIVLWDGFVGFCGFMAEAVGFVGGYKNALLILAGVLSGPLLIAFGVLAKAVLAFGWTLLTNPVGQFIVIIFALGVALKKIADIAISVGEAIEGATRWMLELIFGRRSGEEKKEGEEKAREVKKAVPDFAGFDFERPVIPTPYSPEVLESRRFERKEEVKTVRTEVVVRGENLPRGVHLEVAGTQADKTQIGLTRTMAGAF